jgi:hypothetical protein
MFRRVLLALTAIGAITAALTLGWEILMVIGLIGLITSVFLWDQYSCKEVAAGAMAFTFIIGVLLALMGVQFLIIFGVAGVSGVVGVLWYFLSLYKGERDLLLSLAHKEKK